MVKVFDSDYEVVAWDREEIDITDKDLITKKISEIKPDIIINAAAYNAVDKCEDDDGFELARKINGEAVGYLADAAKQLGALLIYYSTDYVFGGNGDSASLEQIEKAREGGGFKEDDEPRPVNKYAKSKLLGEQELIKRSGNGLKWYLIRTSKLFGPGENTGVIFANKAGKHESFRIKPSFFDIMLSLAQKRKRLDVVNGEISCFTYTPDLAKATKALTESGAGNGIYHITNSGPCTWYEAAVELFKMSETDIKVRAVTADKFPRPARRPKYSVLLNTKLKPLRNWREALKEYLRDF